MLKKNTYIWPEKIQLLVKELHNEISLNDHNWHKFRGNKQRRSAELIISAISQLVNDGDDEEIEDLLNQAILWIKEEIEESIFIIHAKNFDNNQLKSVTITEVDNYYDNKNTLIAEKANIVSKNWNLDKVSLVDKNGNKNYFKSYVHNSSFNGEIISNLFSNLNSLNIYELHNLSNNYVKIGYSNTDVKIHLNRIYSMPIFYILMTILGFIVINKIKNFKSRFFVVIFGVFISVIIYYLNYFSGVLGNNGTLPIYLSVWVPLFILFLICNIGILKINEN